MLTFTSVRRKMVLALVSYAWMTSAAHADYVVLMNGDRLTGTIRSETSEGFVVLTALVGQISVKRADVASVTRDGAAQTSRPPSEAPTWNGALDTSLEISHGNSPSSSLAVHTTVTRVGPQDKFGLFGTFLSASTGSGDATTTSVRAFRGGARYDHDLATRLFGFGFADVEHDALQLLDIRTVAGGGAGVHAVKRASTQVNFTAGASFAHDAYVAESSSTSTNAPTPTSRSNGPPASAPGRGLASAPGQNRSRNGTPPAVVRTALTRDVGELAFGEDLWSQINDAVSLSQRLAVFPAINDPADYRTSFDLVLGVQINGWLHWNATVADRYLRIPPAGGAVQNDLFVSTGLGITFGKGTDGAYTGADGRRTR